MGPECKWRGWVRMPAGLVEHDLLSFWHSETIGKVMVNLTEEEYLIPFSFEKDRGDQSFWYAVNYKKIATLPIESGREEMAPFGSGGVPGGN